MTIATNDVQYGLPDFIVNPVLGRGTHQTIQSAITEAVSGQTIGVNPATYTEDITLKSGITITGMGDGLPSVGIPVLVGKISSGTTANAEINGLLFNNNGDVIFEDVGTTAGTIQFSRCWFQADGVDDIFSGSNTSRSLLINRSTIAMSGSKVFSSTGISLGFRYCNFGGSTNISTISSGTISFNHCVIAPPLQTTGTASLACTNSTFSSDNQLIWDLQGTGVHTAQICSLRSGTAVAINIGASTTIDVTQIDINSTQNTPITGTGNLFYDSIGFIQGGNHTIAPTISGGASRISSLRLGTGGSILNIYESNVFTPVLRFGGATTGITYSQQTGVYTRIGDLVFIEIQLTLTNKGSATGAATITGLPYTSNNTGTTAILNYIIPNGTATANYTELYGAIAANTSFITLAQADIDSSAYATVSSTNFANNTQIQLSGCYRV